MNIDKIKELLMTIDATSLEYVKLKIEDLNLEVSKHVNHIDIKNTNEYNKDLKIDTEDKRVERSIINESSCDLELYPPVISPLMGTFYASPSPDAEEFVKVGDIVEEGDTLCIIEAMKLMNEITSDIKGEIVEVLVKNEELIEYNQPIFKIRPL